MHCFLFSFMASPNPCCEHLVLFLSTLRRVLIPELIVSTHKLKQIIADVRMSSCLSNASIGTNWPWNPFNLNELVCCLVFGYFWQPVSTGYPSSCITCSHITKQLHSAQPGTCIAAELRHVATLGFKVLVTSKLSKGSFQFCSAFMFIF